MVALKFGLFVLFIVGWFISYFRNNDLFSPIKIYIYYSLFFYFSIYFTDVYALTVAVYALLLLSILCLIPVESKSPISDKTIFVRGVSVSSWSYVVLWVLTIPGILVKTSFVYEAGGISNYLVSLAFRVSNWKGEGHLVMLLGMLPIVSLIYFALIVRDKAAGWIRWGGFVLHFIVFISIGLLMGSRSFIAIPLLGYLLSFSYFKRKVSFKVVVIFFLFLVMLVGGLGAFRNNFGSSAGSERLLQESSFELAHFSYGVNPLEIVFSANEHPMLKGESYLSLFTNIIPRSIYEDKLQTGGISFTRYYTGDQWGGMSHLAPSAVGEAIMNFGLVLGVVVGGILTFLVMFAGILFYNKFMASIEVMSKQDSFSLSAQGVFFFVIYYYFVLLAARFSFAEFTNVFFSYFISSLVPAVLFLLLSLLFSGRLYRKNSLFFE